MFTECALNVHWQNDVEREWRNIDEERTVMARAHAGLEEQNGQLKQENCRLLKEHKVSEALNIP
jgi:hypothetical protein